MYFFLIEIGGLCIIKYYHKLKVNGINQTMLSSLVQHSCILAMSLVIFRDLNMTYKNIMMISK
jgi:hypothetical protein